MAPDKEDVTAWALEQFCVAVTSILLGGVILRAFDATWAGHSAAEVLFLLGFLAVMTVNQVGYLQSVKRTPYRWVVPRPLLDLVMVGLYYETVRDWDADLPVWRLLFWLLVAFLLWDAAKVVEKWRAGAYARRSTLPHDLGRTGITAGAVALGGFAWSPAIPSAEYGRELALLFVLMLFWIAKSLPLPKPR